MERVLLDGAQQSGGSCQGLPDVDLPVSSDQWEDKISLRQVNLIIPSRLKFGAQLGRYSSLTRVEHSAE